MPELPEVQTIIEDLKTIGLVERQVLFVEIYWEKSISQPSVEKFSTLLKGSKISGLERRGKYLIFTLSNGYHLVGHLRMTGRLILGNLSTPPLAHVRFRLVLDSNQVLDFHDTRKFGRWNLVNDLTLFFQKLGPEPLSDDFSFEMFWENIHRRNRALKILLLDQHFLAGLGNIYVDEALWEAFLHPLQRANELSQENCRLLYHSIRTVLQRGIDNQGTSLGKGRSNYARLDGERGTHQTLLKVFRRTGQPCLRCGGLIVRIIVGQRSTHLCPYCQKV